MNLKNVMKKFSFYFLLLAVSIIFFSCKKDKIDPYNDPASNAALVTVTELLVQVVDESNQAVSNASVEIYGTTKYTDANGVTQFRNKKIPSKDGCVITNKSGFFHNYSVIHATANSTISLVVTLQPLPTSVNINGSDGGTANAENGGSIVFQENSFVNLSGSEYNGSVSVSASYIDPYSTANNQNLPNSFSGQDKKSNAVFVENKGMLIVELKDASGNELRLADSKTAEIHIPIASTDLADAPKKIPLYYFHKGYGKWIEDGEAKKEGNQYVGEVSHFSFWMCPYVYDHHFLTGQITCSGSPFPGAVVQVFNQYGAFLGAVTTNNAGGFSGSIPETLTHTLKVLDPCGNVIYTQQIGPFSADANLGAIDICPGGNVNYGIVVGSLEDCSGNPETSAYLRIQSTGMIRYLAANISGAFNQPVIFCNGATEASIMGVNQDDLTASTEITLPISNNMDIGTQVVCSTPPQYCAFNWDGTDYYYVPNVNSTFQALVDLGNQNLNELRVSVAPVIKFSIADFTPGVGTTSVGGSNWSYTFETTGNDGLTNLNVNFTTFGSNVGDVIEGTIDNANYNDQGSTPRTLSNCSFRFIL